MKPLDLLPNLTGIQICLYVSNPNGGFPSFIANAIVDLDRVGNMLYNEDRSIAIDMEKLKSKAKTPGGVFKSFTQQIIYIILEDYYESEEAETMNQAIDEELDNWLVLYNKEIEQLYSYMHYGDGRKRFLYLEKDLMGYIGDTAIFLKANVEL